MNVETIDIPGVLLIQPVLRPDDRGYFLETFQAERYTKMGLAADFVQDNLSSSSQHVLRGLHYQLKKPQGKLVYVIDGQVLDVMLDIRVGSPTFGQYCSVILDSATHNQVYVPPGLAHGFCVLSEKATFAYKCTDFYNPGDEYGIIWNDPDLAIDWHCASEPLLSAKDSQFPTLKQADPRLLPIYQG
jgi:dTDP-4-dehydrorhamnose 3,5-epimerase